MAKLRPIAIHLPQFHPIPENDEWWGKGFTEWRNVAKSKPLFEGHYQPHIPSDLGFYDLRLEETRIAQAELASQYGIYGFCYYHYWFNGRRILEKPVDQILASGKPDFPFCLCWANENWTRRWDGEENEVLLHQTYSESDDIEHIHHLFQYFKDDRYIRVDGKPVFVVYKSDLIPDPVKTTSIWRDEAIKAGVGDLYLLRMKFHHSKVSDPTTEGFDGGIEFQPFCQRFTPIHKEKLLDKIFSKFQNKQSPYWSNWIYDYKEIVDTNRKQIDLPYKLYRGATPMWDNSPRRKIAATIITGSTPELYCEWLTSIAESFRPYSKDENFVFINAWNEWAEGNHLEPCLQFGRSYLEATYKAFKDYIGY